MRSLLIFIWDMNLLMYYTELLMFAFGMLSEEMHKFIAEQLNTSRVPLCINPQSAAFKSFAT